MYCVVEIYCLNIIKKMKWMNEMMMVKSREISGVKTVILQFNYFWDKSLPSLNFFFPHVKLSWARLLSFSSLVICFCSFCAEPDQLTTLRSPHLHLLASSAPFSSSSLGCSSSRSSKQQQQGQQLQRWSRTATVLDVRPIFRRQFWPILDSLESTLRVLQFSNLNRFDPCPDRPEISI